MAEMRDSSVLFSLNQLMKLEQQRVLEETEAARMRAEEQAAARLAEERRIREEREARLRAEEQARQEQERRQREEAARLEALRLGEIERARVEAERRAQLEVMNQSQEHERKLVALREDTHKKRLKRALVIGGLVATALFSTGLGVYFGHIKPEAERREQEQAAAIAAWEGEVSKLKTELEQANQRVASAVEAVAKAQDDVARAKALKDVESAQNNVTKVKTRLNQKLNTKTTTNNNNTTQKAPCRTGDPLCTDI